MTFVLVVLTWQLLAQESPGKQPVTIPKSKTTLLFAREKKKNCCRLAKTCFSEVTVFLKKIWWTYILPWGH